MHVCACFVANSIMFILLIQKLCLTGREEPWRSGPGCEKAKSKFRTNFEFNSYNYFVSVNNTCIPVVASTESTTKYSIV